MAFVDTTIILVSFMTALFFILDFMGRNTKLRRVVDQIPGPVDWPFFGHFHLFLAGGHDFFHQLLGVCKKYGDKSGILRLWILGHPVVLLTKAHTVEFLLNSTKHITKAREYRYLLPWLGTGLLTSTGDKWKTRRRILTPSFHFKILNDYLQVFNEQSRVLVSKLSERAGETKPFDIFPYVTLCTLDVICDTAMGKHVSAQSESTSRYVDAIYRIGVIIQARMKTPHYMVDSLFLRTKAGKEHQEYLKILHDFSFKVIKERSDELDKQLANHTGKVSMEDLQTDTPFLIGKQKRLALLDMLLVASKGGADLSHRDIQEEVDTFMFEGHDTTAATGNWAVYLLGAHPEVQKKAQEELDGIFGCDDRDATMDDIKQMHYLEYVLKETMRLFATVPMFGREIEEDCVIDGYTVPKKATAIVVTAALHRDPVYFPNPRVFNPDRWLPENSSGRHPYSYIPFSAGLRNCIGQKFAMNEEKIILASILRHFTITSHQKREELHPVGELIQRPENGILVTLTARSS